jgi:REP element-mobilizing transposase RayT
LKAILPELKNDEEIVELTSTAEKISTMAQTFEAVLGQTLNDAVYWMEVAERSSRRVSLKAAPINVAAGLRMQLFEKVNSVVMTSATLCTSRAAKVNDGPQRKSGRDARVTSGSPRDTGVSPVRTAVDPRQITVRDGAYLPHWSAEGAIYSVTFRLHDALPQHVLKAWHAERDAIVVEARQQGRPLTADESKRLDHLHSTKVEKYLDAGYGSCWLRQDPMAQLVAEALEHFDGRRYRLIAWCIMPNHVHVVLQSLVGEQLPKILHSLKSYTAHSANKHLRRTGEFWQPEYYDHLVRDEQDLRHAVEYIWENPRSAGMSEWKWKSRSDERLAQVLGLSNEGSTLHGRDARVTSSASRDTDGTPVLANIKKGGDDPFHYIRTRLGADDARTLALGSPFDYAKQATLYVETELPEPGDTQRFLPAA